MVRVAAMATTPLPVTATTIPGTTPVSSSTTVSSTVPKPPDASGGPPGGAIVAVIAAVLIAAVLWSRTRNTSAGKVLRLVLRPWAKLTGDAGPWVTVATLLGLSALPALAVPIWPWGVLLALAALVVLCFLAALQYQRKIDESGEFPADFTVERDIVHPYIRMRVENQSEKGRVFSAKVEWVGYGYPEERVRWRRCGNDTSRRIGGFDREDLELLDLDRRDDDTLAFPLLASGGRSEYHKGVEKRIDGREEILRVFVRRKDKALWWEIDVGFQITEGREILPEIRNRRLHDPRPSAHS